MKKIVRCLIAVNLVMAMITGCGFGNRKGIPYPDNYYIPKPVETESGIASSDESIAITGPEEIETIEKTEVTETERSIIKFFFDTSESMERSPEVIKIHAAATKGAAGYKERHFYGMDSGHTLVETTEELALSGKYGHGAPLDLIENGTLPYAWDGVNIITTDLQSNTSCTDLGRWLVNSGCEGYTFYVFTVQYDGSLQFKTYTSNSTFESVSINGFSTSKEFLMIVFGNNKLVEDFDQSFLRKLDTKINFDKCHVSLYDKEENLESFLKLTSSKCFEDDVTNVDFDNTNFVFGLNLQEDKETDFTCDNTFIYKKSRKSTGKAKNSVKAILYAVPEQPVPDVEEVIISHVLEYNSKTSVYEESKVTFEVDTTAYLDGLPSATDDPGSKMYEQLNKALGGPIVPEGPVFVVTVKNENLPKGLYAVEAKVIFKATGEVIDLQRFAASHNAGLEEYSEALQNECEAVVTNGEESTCRFNYTGNGNSSVFCKLLEFERVTDELIAAGAVTDSNNEMISLRLIIDNT